MVLKFTDTELRTVFWATNFQVLQIPSNDDLSDSVLDPRRAKFRHI